MNNLQLALQALAAAVYTRIVNTDTQTARLTIISMLITITTY